MLYDFISVGKEGGEKTTGPYCSLELSYSSNGKSRCALHSLGLRPRLSIWMSCEEQVGRCGG